MKIKHISFDFWNTICKSRKKDQNFNLEDLFFNFSDKTKEKTQTKNKDCYYRVKPTFHIGAKTKTLITEIQNYLKTYNVNLNIYYYNSNDFYVLKSSSKKEIKKLYDLFYSDSKYYLTRKKLSFEKTLLTPSEFKKTTNFEPRNA